MALDSKYPHINFIRPTDFWITIESTEKTELIDTLVEIFGGSVCAISYGRFEEGPAAKIQGIRGNEIEAACSILEQHGFMYLGYCTDKPFGNSQDDSYESQLMKKWRAQKRGAQPEIN